MTGFKISMREPINANRLGFYSIEAMSKEMAVMFNHR